MRADGGPIRLLLVDDHEMVRAGLRTFLGLQPDMEVVGEAGSGEQALALVPRLQPEIVLLDLVLPGMSGLEVVRRLRAAHPAVKVVVLTSYSGEDSVLPAVRAGVAGYLRGRLAGLSLRSLGEEGSAGGPAGRRSRRAPLTGRPSLGRQCRRVGTPSACSKCTPGSKRLDVTRRG